MGDRSWVIPLKMPDSPPNGNRPNAVLRLNALADRLRLRRGYDDRLALVILAPINRHRRGRIEIAASNQF
jgi:hypothetical protein